MIIERDWHWWAYLWRVTHRQKIKGIQEWDKKLVRFAREIVGVKPKEKLLDLGCGSGEHTRLLAKEGIECTGLEIAESLVRYAKGKVREEGVEANYINMDMRDIRFKNEFNCVMLASGTFGYLSDKENFELLKKILKAREFNNEVQHLDKRKGICYYRWLCEKNIVTYPWPNEKASRLRRALGGKND